MLLFDDAATTTLEKDEPEFTMLKSLVAAFFPHVPVYNTK
jgi:hypothetical protein